MRFAHRSKSMKHILNQCPVIAILRNLPEDLLIPYAESILQGGISVFEVAMNTPDGAGQISALKEHFKESVTVGAGTATTIERNLYCGISEKRIWICFPES